MAENFPPTKMPSPPLNYDKRIWSVEQYNELAAWIDQLPPAHQPPGWPGAMAKEEYKADWSSIEEQLNKQIDDLSEQIARLQAENADLRNQLEAGYTTERE